MSSLKFTLGGREFEFAESVFPLRLNLKVYPAIVALNSTGFVERLASTDPNVMISGEDLEAICAILGDVLLEAKSPVTREELNALPASIPELINALMVVRLMTGGWAVPNTEAAAA